MTIGSTTRLLLLTSAALLGHAFAEAANLTFATADQSLPVDGLAGSLPYRIDPESNKRRYPKNEFRWELEFEETDRLARAAVEIPSYSLIRDSGNQLWANGRLPFDRKANPWKLDPKADWLVVIGWQANGKWETGIVRNQANPSPSDRNRQVFRFPIHADSPPVGPLYALAYENGRLANADTAFAPLDLENNNALHQAAIAGQAKAIDEAIKNDPKSLEAANRFGETPLMLAARNGRLEIVKALLEAGIDPNRTNEYGKSVIDLAIESGHRDVLAIALTRATPSHRDWTAYLNYAPQANAGVLATLIDSSGNLKLSKKDRYAIHSRIIEAGRFELAARFEEKFGPLAKKPSDGNRLEHAIAHSRGEVGADQIGDAFDFTVLNNEKRSPIDIALANGNHRLLTELLKRRPDLVTEEMLPDLWEIAILGNRAELVDQLCAFEGAQRQGPDGLSLPMLALLVGQFDLAERLFDRGGRWNFDAPQLENALASCFRADRARCIQHAITQGIDWKAALADGLSPDGLAAYYQSIQIADTLAIALDRGKNPEPPALASHALEVPRWMFESLGGTSFQIKGILCGDGQLRHPDLQDAELPADIERHLLGQARAFSLKKWVDQGAPTPSAIGIAITLKPAGDESGAIAADQADDRPRLLTRLVVARQSQPVPHLTTVTNTNVNGKITSTTTSTPLRAPSQISGNSVKFAYRITDDGAVENIKTIGNGNGATVAAARVSLRDSKYLPARIHGVPVTVDAELAMPY